MEDQNLLERALGAMYSVKVNCSCFDHKFIDMHKDTEECPALNRYWKVIEEIESKLDESDEKK